MSNNLISRSAVMELIESRFVDGCLEMGDKTLIEGYDLLDDVSDLPTAYDVDKVIEQLKERLCSTEDEASDIECHARNRHFRDAIGVVRAGIREEKEGETV